MTAWRSRVAVRVAVFVAILVALTCVTARAAGQSRPRAFEDVVLYDVQGAGTAFENLLRAHRFTAVVFYSSTCPCFAVHVPRLEALARSLSGRDVGFVVIDSERHPGGETQRPAIASVGVALPLFRDPGGKLARRLDAEFATESFVFDSATHLRYRGGIDEDRKHLRPNPKAYLRDALLDLLADHAPAYATSKALGCALVLN